MWEHLSWVELKEEWIKVKFNMSDKDPNVARTLLRIEEALLMRADEAMLAEDDVLPAGKPDLRRAPAPTDLGQEGGTG